MGDDIDVSRFVELSWSVRETRRQGLMVDREGKGCIYLPLAMMDIPSMAGAVGYILHLHLKRRWAITAAVGVNKGNPVFGIRADFLAAFSSNWKRAVSDFIGCLTNILAIDSPI